MVSTGPIFAHEVVKTGDIVKVRVTEVDVGRKRIGLTMKLDAAPARWASGRPAVQSAPATAMASAFGKLAGLKKIDPATQVCWPGDQMPVTDWLLAVREDDAVATVGAAGVRLMPFGLSGRRAW